MRRHDRFEQGLSTFICQVCDRRTRNTGQDVDHLCNDCYEIAGIDNTINDSGYKPGMPEFDEFQAELKQRIGHIAKLGGNVTKVMRSNEFCFPPGHAFSFSTGDSDMTALTNEQIDKMTKAELSKACKARGIKAGKLSLMQQREALKKDKEEPAPKVKAKREMQEGPRPGSKMEKATEIYAANKDKPRKEILKLFETKAGLTKAGANTYYALIVKAAKK